MPSPWLLFSLPFPPLLFPFPFHSRPLPLSHESTLQTASRSVSIISVASRPVIGWRLSPSKSTLTDNRRVWPRPAVLFQMHAGDDYLHYPRRPGPICHQRQAGTQRTDVAVCRLCFFSMCFSFAPGTDTKYSDCWHSIICTLSLSVYLPVCAHAYLKNSFPNLTKFSVHCYMSSSVRFAGRFGV